MSGGLVSSNISRACFESANNAAEDALGIWDCFEPPDILDLLPGPLDATLGDRPSEPRALVAALSPVVKLSGSSVPKSLQACAPNARAPATAAKNDTVGLDSADRLDDESPKKMARAVSALLGAPDTFRRPESMASASVAHLKIPSDLSLKCLKLKQGFIIRVSSTLFHSLRRLAVEVGR